MMIITVILAIFGGSPDKNYICNINSNNKIVTTTVRMIILQLAGTAAMGMILLTMIMV